MQNPTPDSQREAGRSGKTPLRPRKRNELNPLDGQQSQPVRGGPSGSHEERRLREALAQANGSPAKAAELLGVTRMTVWRRMNKYGIEVKRVVA